MTAEIEFLSNIHKCGCGLIHLLKEKGVSTHKQDPNLYCIQKTYLEQNDSPKKGTGK